MSETGNHPVADYLKNNPRLMGLLFTALVALSQAGNALATAGSTNPGP